MGKNINFGFGLELPKEGFGSQNQTLLNTCGNRNTSVSPSLIFEGVLYGLLVFILRDLWFPL